MSHESTTDALLKGCGNNYYSNVRGPCGDNNKNWLCSECRARIAQKLADEQAFVILLDSYRDKFDNLFAEKHNKDILKDLTRSIEKLQAVKA